MFGNDHRIQQHPRTGPGQLLLLAPDGEGIGKLFAVLAFAQVVGGGMQGLHLVRLCKEAAVGGVHQHALRTLVVVAHHDRVFLAVQFRRVVAAAKQAHRAAPVDFAHLAREHPQVQPVQVVGGQARPAPCAENLVRGAPGKVPALRTQHVGVEEMGDGRVRFLHRQRAPAEGVVQLAVHRLAPVHAGGLGVDAAARVRGHPVFQFVEGAEEPFNGLGLPVVGPCVDHLHAQVFVQTHDPGLPEVGATLEVLGAERLAVVEVGDARHLAEADAGPPQGGADAGRVLGGHQFPPQRVVAGPVEPQHHGHAAGLARVRVGRLEVQGVAVGDEDVAHFHQSPVALEPDGGLVVPRLLALADEGPFRVAVAHVLVQEASDGGRRRHVQPFGLAQAGYLIAHVADGRVVDVQRLAEDDLAVPLGKQRLAPVGKAALVRNGHQVARAALLHLPAFQRFPACLAHLLQQFRPRAALVGRHEVGAGLHGGAVLAQPPHVQPHEVRPGESQGAALGVHGGQLVHRHRSVVLLGGRYLAQFRRPDGEGRIFGHGRNEPFVATAAPLALAGIPPFALCTAVHRSMCAQPQETN